MTDPYLIAHKVRGEPAFDVAIRMECSLCREDGGTISWGCPECDSLGYWWIIPTSGHRAYPYWYCPFEEIGCLDKEWAGDEDRYLSLNDPRFPSMPPSLPDHYAHRATPTISLTEALGIRPAPQPKIVRRM